MASVWGESRTEGWLLLCVGRKQAPRSFCCFCLFQQFLWYPPSSLSDEGAMNFHIFQTPKFNQFLCFWQSLSAFFPLLTIHLFPRFINMGKNRKLNWTWKKTVIELGLCYVEFLLDLFLPLKIAMCSSGASEGSRLLQSFVPPCGEGGDTHRKTTLINGTSKAVVIYQTRSVY